MRNATYKVKAVFRRSAIKSRQLRSVQQEDFVILHKHDDIINIEGEISNFMNE